MKTYFAEESFIEPSGPSIFLAGPTPRSPEVKSWRPEALKMLEDLKYEGNVFVPEAANWGFKGWSYEAQVEWEEAALCAAYCILFWIPRKMDTMPALTTNVEYGMYLYSGKIVLGVPPDAERCKYQIYYAKKLKIPFATTLQETVKNAMNVSQEKYAPILGL